MPKKRLKTYRYGKKEYIYKFAFRTRFPTILLQVRASANDRETLIQNTNELNNTPFYTYWYFDKKRSKIHTTPAYGLHDANYNVLDTIR